MHNSSPVPETLTLSLTLTLIPTETLCLLANQVLLLTERTAALQRTAEPDGGSGASGASGASASASGEGGGGGPGGPEEAALSEEVELVCRGVEWLRHYAELNQATP